MSFIPASALGGELATGKRGTVERLYGIDLLIGY